MESFIVIFHFLVINLYIFRWKIINRLPDESKSHLTFCIKDIKFHIGVWWKTLLVPILVVIIYYIVWILFSYLLLDRFITNPISVKIPQYVLTSVILAPISEQIVQCIFLNLIFLMTLMLCKNQRIIKGVNIVGLMFVAFIMVIPHINAGIGEFFVRFISFTIYGGLFYFNDRNILPTIIAHSAWNLILLIPYFSFS